MINSEILKEGSRLIKESTPVKLVKTTDMFPSLNAFERLTLYKAERLGLKLLTQTNK